MKLRTLLAGCLLCLTLPAWSAAQEQQPGMFGEVIEVRVVNLEVVVTDKDGIRVSGLKPEDFRLEVDGDEVPIEYFSEILGGTAVKREGTPGLPKLTPGEPVGTSYLLFIDDFFSIVRDRNQVLDALVEDLPVVGPGDRMAVVAYDGRKLEMLTSWTDSPTTLEKALKEASRRDTQGLRRLSELRSFEAERRDLGRRRLRDPGRLDFDEERYANEVASQVSQVVNAAAATLRGFAAPPGRKVMLLLSGGWPYQPAEYAVGEFGRILDSREVVGGPVLYQELVDTANRLGYTLYPVDVPGLQGLAETGAVGTAPTVGPAEQVGFVREQGIHAALDHLAEATGGRAVLNAERLDALPKALEDTRSYYWLGFSPPWEGDDAVHDIRVRMAGDGYEVRSRESFLDLSRSRQISNMVESSLLFGNPPSSRPLQVEFGKAKRAGFGKVSMPMRVLVPATEVAILPVEGGYGALLELRIAAIDSKGQSSDVAVQRLAMKQEEPPDENTLLAFTTEIKLRRAEHDLIVSIYDPASGALLAARKTVIPHR